MLYPLHNFPTDRTLNQLIQRLRAEEERGVEIQMDDVPCENEVALNTGELNVWKRWIDVLVNSNTFFCESTP